MNQGLLTYDTALQMLLQEEDTKSEELSPSTSGPLCYCRFCGQEKQDLVSAHSESLQYIMRKALQYFSIQVSRQDILPQGICLLCLDNLYSCVQYMDRFENAQSKLTAMVEDGYSFASTFQGINETTDAAVISIIQAVHDEVEKNREVVVQNHYLCDLCGKCFATLHNLRRHRKTHLSDDIRKPFTCETCSKSFCTRNELSEHENIHKDVKPYSCPVCNKSFHKKVVMRQHSLIHNVRPHKYECEQCSSKFHRRSRFIHHMKLHNKQEVVTCPKSYQCTICSEIFPHVSSLYNHRKLKHSDERMIEESESNTSKDNYTCDICDKLLANKRSLLYHQKAVHTQERPFVCLLCNTGFMSRFSYNIHMRKHTGEQPYRCSVCKATFRSYAPLKRHQIRKHNMTVCNDNVEFKCLFCLRVFSHRIALHNHVATHISSNQQPLQNNNNQSPDTCQ